MKRLVPLFGAIAMALAVSAGASEVGELLDAVVQAYGGEKAVQRLAAYRVDADVESKMQGAVGKARRDFQAPDRLRVQIVYPAVTEVRILDGSRGWRGDASQLQRVEGLPKLAMEYQMLRSTVPESLNRHRKLLENRGVKQKEGMDYRVIGLRWSENLDLDFWVDPKNHRVVWVEGLLRGGGMESSFATRYGDFRTVDGVLVPFAEGNYASGQHTGDTRVTAVRFSPPDLGPFDPTGARR